MAVLIVALALQASAAPSPEPDPWDRFPVFVWRQDHKDRVPLELVAGLGGVNVERDAPAADVLEHDVDFYVGHGPGRDDLHLERDAPGYLPMWRRWYRERDDAVLVRTPCLTAEATRTRLFETLDRTLAARGGRHGIGVSLGDEVSLTPWADPLDLCHSPTCRTAFEAWSRARHGRVLPWVGTDRVRREWTAGDTSSITAWLARRDFHHHVVLDLLAELAQRARAHPSSPAVGLLGLAGRNAFGNVAVDRALAFCDFVEPYATVDARHLAFTLRSEDQRVLRTIFPDERGPDGVAHDVWEHFLRGGDGLVIWSDRVLAQRPAVRARLVAVVARIRAHLREHGRYLPRPHGVAVVHDDRSIALAFLKDALLDGPTWPKRFGGYQLEHGTWERDVVAWLALFEELGAQPGALPLERVDAGTVERFPLLILNHVAVLGEPERSALEAYLEAGGRIVVWGAEPRFAAADPADPGADPGAGRDDAPARTLRERFPDRFRVHASALASHATRTAARGWLDAAGVRAAPWRAPGADARLVTWARTADGRTVVGLLPRAGSGPGAAPPATLDFAPDPVRAFEAPSSDRGGAPGAGESADPDRIPVPCAGPAYLLVTPP